MSWLFSRLSARRFESFPSSTGMAPDNGFPLRPSLPRFDSFPSSGGMPPVKSLPWSWRSVSSDRFASSTGMVPVSSCLASVRRSSFERPPSAAGIVPLSVILRPYNGPLVFRSSTSLVTRLGDPPRVMPCQLASAVSALQLSGSVPRSVSFAPSSSAQSATSPGLSAGLGTTVPFSHGGAGVVCGAAGGDDAPRSPPACLATVAAVVGCGPASEVRTIAAVSAATSTIGAARPA